MRIATLARELGAALDAAYFFIFAASARFI